MVVMSIVAMALEEIKHESRPGIQWSLFLGTFLELVDDACEDFVVVNSVIKEKYSVNFDSNELEG